MGKFTENIKKHLMTYLLSFSISILVGVAVFLIFFFVQGQTITASLNGTGIAFAIVFAGGALVWLHSLGAFDTFAYGFKQVANSMFSKEANRYNDFSQYKQDKRDERVNAPRTYYVILSASFVFLIAFIILEIVKSTMF